MTDQPKAIATFKAFYQEDVLRFAHAVDMAGFCWEIRELVRQEFNAENPLSADGVIKRLQQIINEHDIPEGTYL